MQLFSREWRQSGPRSNGVGLDGGKTAFNLPRPNSKPKIRPALQNDPKAIASRFYQPLRGHAMIAPILKDTRKWTDSDQCWCDKGRRRTREHHPPKECKGWRKEIHTLWEKVGGRSGRARNGNGEVHKSRKGFGCNARGMGCQTEQYRGWKESWTGDGRHSLGLSFLLFLPSFLLCIGIRGTR